MATLAQQEKRKLFKERQERLSKEKLQREQTLANAAIRIRRSCVAVRLGMPSSSYAPLACLASQIEGALSRVVGRSSPCKATRICCGNALCSTARS